MSSDAKYQPMQAQPLMLSTADLNDEAFSHEKEVTSPPAYERQVVERKRKHVLLVCSLLANAMLTIALAWLWASYHGRFAWKGVDLVWSPVNDIISHVYVRYPDVHDVTPYHSPIDTSVPREQWDLVDEAWEKLYQWGISAIPKSEAANLERHTIQYADDPGMYIVELDVFHQLHCLNSLRRSLYPEIYPHNNGTFTHGISAPFHLEHCINSIRESLMCSADVTPAVWGWDVPLQTADPHFNLVHTCRNWDDIHDWVVENTARTKFNKDRLIPDDLVYKKNPYKDVIQRYTKSDYYNLHHNE